MRGGRLGVTATSSPANKGPVVSGRPRVLLVEDDAALRDSLAASLRAEGYEVRAEPDGRHVPDALERFRPDLALLDVRLPEGPDGYSLARLISSRGSVPLFFLTAAASLGDRLQGFAVGADDYLTKPFNMAELLVRIRALLRRAGRLESAVRQVDDLVVDEAARSAYRAGNELDLTPTEFELLAKLVRQPGRALSKQRLLSLVWGSEEYDANVVEVHISALRRKLEEHGPRLIHTVRGAGYLVRSE